MVGVAGEVLSGHRLVAVDGAGAMVYASDFNAIGLTLNAALVGGNVAVQQSGFVSEPSWNWTPSLPIFQAEMGQLTQVRPVTGTLRRVATALSPTKIALDFQPPTILI